MRSGLKTPIAEIPTPDFAVPYAAPKHVKTMAAVHPIVPKNGYVGISVNAMLPRGLRSQWNGSEVAGRVYTVVDEDWED
jgi:hypothetical protein